jgi:hypothetical protein
MTTTQAYNRLQQDIYQTSINRSKLDTGTNVITTSNTNTTTAQAKHMTTMQSTI